MKLGSTRRLDSPSPRAVGFGAFVLALCAMLALNALAFNSSLQPEEVQDAYSLGQTANHEELANFLKQYEHIFAYPPNKPVAYVQSVEFQTPYEQIVLRAQRTIGYSKFKAQEDYQANSGLVIVRVVISLKINYAGPVPPEDSFKVLVSQAKPIEPKKITNAVTCDPYYSTNYAVNTDCRTYTREILLRFDAEEFAPGRTTIKVMLPYGQSLETKYNLDKLK